MNKKPVVLWLSDSPFINTGYSTMSKKVMNELSEEFDFHFLSHNYIGQNISSKGVNDNDLNFKFNVIGMGREGYCKDIIIPYIQKLKPDYFVVLLDTFMLYPWIMDFNFAPAKSVFYYPSDGGGGLPQSCENILKHFNRGISMSKYGQRQVKAIHNLDTDYIPPTCELDVFRPLSKIEKEQVKDELKVLMINGQPAPKGFLKNKFVVGTVARNQGRKMLDKTIKAFAIFAKDKPDAVLYMHTDMNDNAAVFHLPMLISRLGLENRVCFSDIKFYDNYPRKDMNKVYNVMDIFMLSTSGEGFGIPIVEAMACEIPCVVTDYTTTYELLQENGVCGISVPMLEIDKTFQEFLDEGKDFKQIDEIYTLNSTLTGSWTVERGLISTKKCADAMNTYYKDRTLIEKHGKMGRVKALKGYNDKAVMDSWRKFFKDNLNG